MDSQLISIGVIVNTQGHRGEVRVIPLTDFPDRFKKMKKAIVDIGGSEKEYNIETVRRQKQFIIIKFQEIENMNEAEKLKSSYIKVRPEELVELEEGSFYVFQIIGLEVYNEEGLYLGKVADVIQTGANDVYAIKSSEGKEILLPAIKDIVKEIDLSNQKMIVSPLEEY